MQNGQSKYQGNDIEQLVLENRTLAEENTTLRTELEYYKHELDKLKRMIYGSKSERYVPANDGQLALNLEAETVEQKAVETEQIAYTRQKPQKETEVNHYRAPIPAHLPREEYVINPAGDLTGAKKIGEEITEILEYNPGRLYVKKYIRYKYALPQDGGILIGELPSLPIPKGNAGPGLLAHLTVNKFADHLPFYRQAQMFKREGVEIAESTINGWFTATCNLIEPLYDKLCDKITRSSYLMVDETPIPVLTKDKPGSTHKGYHWVYYSPLDKLVCFDYRKGRGRDGPVDFLKSYRGTIQTDGYTAYDIFDKPGEITLLSCMAHARRKFDEARQNDPEAAGYVLTEMQKLYDSERQAKELNLSFDDRRSLRIEKSLPVLNDLEKWMKEKIVEVLPKSAIGIAISYTLGLWNRLIRYIDDGRYEIDNNLVENSIRPVALGRKNYLFAGSHEGAERAAMMYSFLGTCKKNNVNYFTWLKDILERIPEHKANRLDELLPGEWLKNSTAHNL
jgi:transposase